MARRWVAGWNWRQIAWDLFAATVWITCSAYAAALWVTG
jgi:hypothetical protein